jgi:hypothetical protein
MATQDNPWWIYRLLLPDSAEVSATKPKVWTVRAKALTVSLNMTNVSSTFPAGVETEMAAVIYP